jgi:LmbE family N-acetylglucosaminyl deacetylase
MFKSLFLSPHDDDSTLFGSFTCMREKPTILVCTDAFIQNNRGEKGCDAETRAKESEEAHKILGCDTLRLGLRDDEVTGELLDILLRAYDDYEVIYAPQVYENGNPHHNLVGIIAEKVFGDKVIFYSTYTRNNLWENGDIEVIPTKEELDLKNKALLMYNSQINLPSTRPHFLAVLGRSEWIYEKRK